MLLHHVSRLEHGLETGTRRCRRSKEADTGRHMRPGKRAGHTGSGPPVPGQAAATRTCGGSPQESAGTLASSVGSHESFYYLLEQRPVKNHPGCYAVSVVFKLKLPNVLPIYSSTCILVVFKTAAESGTKRACNGRMWNLATRFKQGVTSVPSPELHLLSLLIESHCETAKETACGATIFVYQGFFQCGAIRIKSGDKQF